MPQRLGWRVGVHESLMFDRVEIRRDAGFEREEAPTLRYLLLDFCHSYMFEPCRRDMGVEWFVKENYHYCRVTLLIDRSAFCGINESGMFAGLGVRRSLFLAASFVRATFPPARPSHTIDVHVLQRSDLLEGLSVGLVRA